MIDKIVAFFIQFPPVLAIFILSFLPLTEKVALPIAVASFKMPLWSAFFWVLLGNLVPIFIILSIGEKLHLWLSSHSGFLGRAWARTILHMQRKFSRYQKYELWGLFLFMALPLPLNGGISASVIALILGVPAKKAWPYLLAGVLISNLIVLGVTFGVLKSF